MDLLLNIKVIFFKLKKKNEKKMSVISLKITPELYDRAKKCNIIVKRVVKMLLEDYLTDLEQFQKSYRKHEKNVRNSN